MELELYMCCRLDRSDDSSLRSMDSTIKRLLDSCPTQPITAHLHTKVCPPTHTHTTMPHTCHLCGISTGGQEQVLLSESPSGPENVHEAPQFLRDREGLGSELGRGREMVGQAVGVRRDADARMKIGE